MRPRPTSILLYQHGELSIFEAFPMAIRLVLFRSDRETARRFATVSALFRVSLSDPHVRTASRPVPYNTLFKVALAVVFLASLGIVVYNMTHGPGGVYSTAVCR